MTTPVKLWRRQKNVSSLLGKKGKILLWTMIRIPSKTFMSQAPYPVVIVEFTNGLKTTLQLVDWQNEDLLIGREIVTVLRRNNHEDKTGVIPYCIKAKPI